MDTDPRGTSHAGRQETPSVEAAMNDLAEKTRRLCEDWAAEARALRAKGDEAPPADPGPQARQGIRWKEWT